MSNMDNPIIECEDIKKVYRTGMKGRVRALDGVNLEVKPGEIFGLLGPNGAGKTTLVKIILGLVVATNGRVKLFGKDARDHRARAKVGYLPENPNLPPYLKGGQVMQLFGKLSGMSDNDIEARSMELLKEVKMDQWADKKTSSYSKGMIQRVGLAQSMISDPDVIFLDEPTDGVDPLGRREIRDVLIGLKKQGKTIFINSHLLSETEMLCDRVIIMEKGKVVAEGGIDELTAAPDRYSIKCENLENGLLDKINSISSAANSTDGVIDVRVSNIEQLNEVLDTIRSDKVLISSVTPIKQSLESYFVDLIKDIRGEENGQ